MSRATGRFRPHVRSGLPDVRRAVRWNRLCGKEKAGRGSPPTGRCRSDRRPTPNSIWPEGGVVAPKAGNDRLRRAAHRKDRRGGSFCFKFQRKFVWNVAGIRPRAGLAGSGTGLGSHPEVCPNGELGEHLLILSIKFLFRNISTRIVSKVNRGCGTLPKSGWCEWHIPRGQNELRLEKTRWMNCGIRGPPRPEIGN